MLLLGAGTARSVGSWERRGEARVGLTRGALKCPLQSYVTCGV